MGNTPARSERMIEDMDPQNIFNRGQVTVNRGTERNPQPFLEFNSIHGEYIALNSNGKVARREQSFCKGVVFTNRPVLVNEVICVRLSEVSAQWSGVMRFGVTSVDPASFRDIELPKFACPDLTSKGGFWCKTLPERFSVQGKILHFSVDSDGNLSYGVNGQSQGIFMSKINTRGQLWGMFDLYGNCKALELMELTRLNRVEVPEIRNSSSEEELDTVNEQFPMSDLKFHRIHSGNIVITRDSTIATRIGADYCQAYVFSHRPVQIMEKISLIVMKHEPEFAGSMAFGVTSCDPAEIENIDDLPRDSDNLLDRKEYWTCIKNVAVNPKRDETAVFWFTNDGEVMFSKNGYDARTIMHVDVSIPLWVFFDLYGSTVKIKLTDVSEISIRPRIPMSTSPAELGVVSPPRRSSSTEINRLNLANEYGVRVQLPEQGLLTVQSAPTSTRRSPLDGQDDSSSDETTINDLNSRLNAIRDRSRRVTSVQLDLDQLRNQLSRLNTGSPQSERSETARSDDERRRRRQEMTDNIRQIARLEATLSANRSELDRLSAIIPSESSRRATEGADVLASERTSSVLPPLRVPMIAYSSPPMADLSERSQRNSSPVSRVSSIMDRIRAANAATQSIVGDVPTTSSSVVTASVSAPAVTAPVRTNSVERSSSGDSVQDGGINSECIVCMSDRVNSVLYRCGHMCMCFGCAEKTMQTTRNCPLCRQMILDVIKCYQS
ncbi:unnamed protein product [Bursaphelenchus okinawaensis]|uniref:Uncharacterized protein n=1 Tax=Bursaphelenchus okinawaensis TaxID=465554 RepID=A0A811KN20_9BILA|nr:unnamed protein product [Bursaphelenchus okinawaensis]CAG9106431.1 unnamed protein product [Bursaphelenchus okinawaensis]